jgi:hypothetical protein
VSLINMGINMGIDMRVDARDHERRGGPQ